MREFTNPKAIELHKQAQTMEKDADYLLANGSVTSDYYAELMTEAAGIRVLADDVEDGMISEEELKGA